ncbi:phosphotransferase family protein [Rathayibacter sp. CAU 1779]
MAVVDTVSVVVAHSERATLRVGVTFLKVDSDQSMTDREVEAMRLAPIPTPTILWRTPPVLAMAAVRGEPLGHLGAMSAASPAAWAAAGAVARTLHDAPLPPWQGRSLVGVAQRLDAECGALTARGILPAALVADGRRIAEAALRPSRPVFMHGDFQVEHVFVAGDEVTGVIDWSEAGRGNALFDLATLTLGHEEHLADVVAGYGADVDLDAIRSWWAVRCLLAIRWLIDNGFDAFMPGAEVDVLRSLV